MQSAVFKIVILSALHDSGILVQNVGTQRSGVQFKREKIEAFGGIFFILAFLCNKQEKTYPDRPNNGWNYCSLRSTDSLV
jgi:hypothetical protein